eukprot:TRINITY_DN18863_c0_g1_i1.p1 TRINITY_DN18863_c0_g1~~TRINITY_DN18863_c0_g1_i1.p1  ORF type:complete len:202 (+),score=30.62 TRINITY_DN18863_c0_g1_i1:88-693(+)
MQLALGALGVWLTLERAFAKQLVPAAELAVDASGHAGISLAQVDRDAGSATKPGPLEGWDYSKPDLSETWTPDLAKTDSDKDGIGSEDTYRPNPISPTMKREWRTDGDHLRLPSPTKREIQKYRFKQASCANGRFVVHCGVQGIDSCSGSFEVKSGVGYQCIWDTDIWPPFCKAYRSRSSTIVCLEGTCGATTPGSPDKCW